MHLKKTPLHAFHNKHGAKLVPFAGWEMPVQYSGILEEHKNVRNQAGLFDVSHMGEAAVEGKEAKPFLDYVCTNKFHDLKPGRARYTLICQPDGGCVDDVIVYCRDDERFLICLNAANSDKDIQWLQQHAENFKVKVSDESAEWAQLALQGPVAEKILQRLTSTQLKDIPFFGFEEGEIAGVSLLIARTGYTGEPGFELYVPPEQATELAEKLLETGKEDGLTPVGLGARDSLRLEAGYPLYGHEISESISPLEGGLQFAVKLKKEGDFIGKSALHQQKQAGIPRQIIHYRLQDRRIARPGTPIEQDNQKVGEVVSGTHSPTLNAPMGSALIRTDAANASSTLYANIRNKHYHLDIIQPPIV